MWESGAAPQDQPFGAAQLLETDLGTASVDRPVKRVFWLHVAALGVFLDHIGKERG